MPANKITQQEMEFFPDIAHGSQAALMEFLFIRNRLLQAWISDPTTELTTERAQNIMQLPQSGEEGGREREGGRGREREGERGRERKGERGREGGRGRERKGEGGREREGEGGRGREREGGRGREREGERGREGEGGRGREREGERGREGGREGEGE